MNKKYGMNPTGEPRASTKSTAPRRQRAPFADALQAEIRALVKPLLASQEVVPGAVRRLCRLARRWQMGGEEFRQRLVRAGLASSRACEIKTVLAAVEICDAFLAAPPLPWEAALKQARSVRWQAEGFDEFHRLAAKLVALMNQHGLPHFDHARGHIRLHVRAVETCDVALHRAPRQLPTA